MALITQFAGFDLRGRRRGMQIKAGLQRIRKSYRRRQACPHAVAVNFKRHRRPWKPKTSNSEYKELSSWVFGRIYGRNHFCPDAWSQL